MARPLASLRAVLSNLEALRARAAEMQQEEAELVRDLTALRSARAAILQAIQLLESRERLPLDSQSGTLDAMAASEIATGESFRPGIPGRRPAGEDLITETAKRTGLSLADLARKLDLPPTTLKSWKKRGGIPEAAAKRMRALAAGKKKQD